MTSNATQNNNNMKIIDEGAYTGERISIVEKILENKGKYSLSADQFIGILNYIINMDNKPINFTRCEDILFELLTRMVIGHEIDKWFGVMIIDKFTQNLGFEYLDQNDIHERKNYIIREFSTFMNSAESSKINSLDLWKFYCVIDNKYNTSSMPSFSVTEQLHNRIMVSKMQ